MMKEANRFLRCAHAEFFHLVDVVSRCAVVMRHDGLELNKVCDIENWCFIVCDAGTYQRPVEVRQALSLLLIVDDFRFTRGAKVSCYRYVPIVEGKGEVEFTDARYVLEDQVGVRGASACYANTSLSTMTEPHREVIRVLNESALHWDLRFTSFFSMNVALLWQIVASYDQSRLVLEQGGCQLCALGLYAVTGTG